MSKHYEQRKASNKRYLATQDEIKIRVPKGHRDLIKAHAESNGESVNSYIIRLISEDIKKRPV